MRRRELLAAALAGSALPASALATAGGEDVRLRAALDALSGLDSPAEKLTRLATFDPAALSPSPRIDLETVRAGLDVDRRLAASFPFGRLGRSPYLVSPVSGAWRDRDANPVRIAEQTEQLRADAAQGIVLPRQLLDATATAISAAAGKRDGAAGAALRAQALLLAALRNKAPMEPGVGRLPHGDGYYTLLLERHFGAAISAAEAHRRFTDKARELGAHADAVLRRLGYGHGSIGARIRAAFRDPRFLYSDDSAGRDRAVADMNLWLDRARRRIPALIGPVPSQCLDVSVRRMSAKEEAEGRQGYRIVPQPEESGVYRVDLERIRDRPSWTLGAVVHHELLPGHMVQLPIEAMANPHPLRLEYAPAFAEGWAIYAEELAARDGAFAGNDRALLGHLHWMLFRIGRALVDTGVHFKQTSYAQTSSKLAELLGEAAYFAPMAQDIERICIEPGMRAAEALTWLGLAQRGRRAGVAGTQTLRNFHHRVLAFGRKRFAMIE